MVLANNHLANVTRTSVVGFCEQHLTIRGRISAMFVHILFTVPALVFGNILEPKKTIDFFVNFPTRTVDFLLGNNSNHWANSSALVSPHVGTIFQCCNGFELGADGRQEYLHHPGHEKLNNTWSQAAFVQANKRVLVNLDPRTNATVTAAMICKAALARKESYADELIRIATRERISGFTLDWEQADGNDVGCFNELWSYVASALRPHNLSVSVCIDDSNHQGPMDLNSTQPWSTEWDWLGFVPWA